MYRISGIRTAIRDDRKTIRKKIEKRIGKYGKGLKIQDITIVKESLDARDKKNITWVYTVDFRTEPKANLPLTEGGEQPYRLPPSGTLPCTERPVVCGFGPAGMFCALILAEAGYRPIVLERGKRTDERVRDVERFWQEGILDAESNVQFGEGGAGTFSDGKLVSGIRDPRVRKVLHEFVEAGAKEEILYRQKPHVGTDQLRRIVVNLREKILRYGGTVLFSTRLEEVEITNGAVSAAIVSSGSTRQRIETNAVVLAVGHSARDTMRKLYSQGLQMEQKPFSIGVRIEHSQKAIDTAQYGAPHEVLALPPAEYKLSHRNEEGRGVYTFCMCPGGTVIAAASQNGMSVTNGMSYSARDGANANSALLVDVRPSDFETDHPLAGISFQERYERLAFENGSGVLHLPNSSWGEFKSASGDGMRVRNSIPKFASEAMLEAMPHLARKLKGFDDADARVTAVESRSSSPVRIPRNEAFESNWKGLYPAGEGAGYAGGIVSAASDGIRVAEAFIRKYQKIIQSEGKTK